jgi:dUTP pyrophosphatase
MLVYLAHPIDRHSDGLQKAMDRQITYIKHSMKGKAHHLYHPAGAFTVGGHTKVDGTIEAINRAAQEASDGLVVLWPEGATSWGVPAEVERARHLKQPVAIISDSKPTWSMPTDETDPLVAWFRPDPGNYHKAFQFLERNQQSRRRSGNTVFWKEIKEGGKQPTRAYKDDAGMDLYVSETTTIQPHTFMDVPTGIAVELPGDSWGMLTGRSSTTRNLGLFVNQGIIDPGYRGHLYIGCWNLTPHPVVVVAGDRIAQLIVIDNRTADLVIQEVHHLYPHARGDAGFGSTGQ